MHNIKTQFHFDEANNRNYTFVDLNECLFVLNFKAFMISLSKLVFY